MVWCIEEDHNFLCESEGCVGRLGGSSMFDKDFCVRVLASDVAAKSGQGGVGRTRVVKDPGDVRGLEEVGVRVGGGEGGGEEAEGVGGEEGLQGWD